MWKHNKALPKRSRICYRVYETVNNELNLLTDWYTDKIFDVVEISSLVFPYSRLFCDVERLVEDEPLESVGRGYFYTHTDNGSLLRANNDNKENIYENYYKPHHNKLLSLVESKLRSNGKVTIIDCHSFNNQPLKTDLDQNNNRPDICLGVDTYHTNQELIDKVYNLYTSHGYTVAINSPYVGTIVPLEYYSINPNVQSIMIEVNKKLYL